MELSKLFPFPPVTVPVRGIRLHHSDGGIIKRDGTIVAVPVRGIRLHQSIDEASKRMPGELLSP